jgi:hypothetical protein
VSARGRSGRAGLARVLAFLRSRLLGAVTLPALIGAAWAWRAGAFGARAAGVGGEAGGLAGAGGGPAAPAWLRLAIALAGLAAVELLNLFGADYVRHAAALRAARGGKRPGPAAGPRPKDGLGPVLPGNPVVSPRRLQPAAIPFVLLGLAAAGAAALLYFAWTTGAGVLAFLLPAAAVGALYVFSPFPYAFLATALVPPLVAGGVAFILVGRAPAGPFLAALPVSLVSAGVILTYQVAYRRERPPALWARALVVLLPYVLADVAVALLLLARVYPRAGFFALLPAIMFPGWAARLVLTETRDPVPTTAVGVFLHSALCLAIAAGLFWG